MIYVKKRDGSVVEYDQDRIRQAVCKALEAVNVECGSIPDNVVSEVEAVFSEEHVCASVEDIQDAVEKALMKYNPDAAKAYILYREQHTKLRKDEQVLLDVQKLIDEYLNHEDWRVNENSNAGYSYASLINHISGAMLARYTLKNLYPREIANAHINGDFHIHDLSAGIVGYCAGWSLRDILLKGFVGGTGRPASKPAKHLDSALLQLYNYLCTLQTEWAGAQAVNSFDTLLAPFVREDGLDEKEVKQKIQQFVFGLNSGVRLGQCVPITTKCLKSDGTWVNGDELSVGDEIMVFDVKTGRLKTDTVKHVTNKNYTGKLHNYYNGHGFNFSVTPDHRVVFKTASNSVRIKESSELLGYKSPIDIPISGKYVLYNCPDSQYSDELIEFITFVLCDGCIQTKEDRSTTICFYKSNNRWGGERFQELCRQLQFEYSTHEERGGFDTPVVRYSLLQSPRVARLCELLSDTKKTIPSIMMQLPPNQAKLVINTWAKLDGYDGDHTRVQCDNESIQNAVLGIAVRAGYACRASSRVITGNKTPTLYVDIYQRKFRSCHVQEVDYSGKVWCPTTDTGTFVACTEEGNVFITGNCPFTNVSFDWTVPEDMKDQPIIIGGEFQDHTYSEYEKEMGMLNKAFLEVMLEGDGNGRIFSFPIPTYNITKDFNWDAPEDSNEALLFKVTGKYGTPYFQNFINSDLDPGQVRSMCCRLQLNLKELRKKTGGLFGSGDKTGSIGVVTINMPRLGYTSKNKAGEPNYDKFYRQLTRLLVLAKNSLELKRKEVWKNYQRDLMPYTKCYLPNLDSHFSTIGLVGMNECCLNLFGKDITTEEGQKFSKEVLTFINEKLKEFQEETGHIYNSEASPAEATSYRLARIDVKKYPDIITAGTDVPYYTNSTQLPVGFTDDLFEALDLQDDLQAMYTGGTVFHAYIGESIDDWNLVRDLVRRVASEYRLPYFSLTPTFSICPVHGYIKGNHPTCPHCD